MEKTLNQEEIIRDNALNLGADELVLARPRRFLWVRLRASGRDWGLMFRLPAAWLPELPRHAPFRPIKPFLLQPIQT